MTYQLTRSTRPLETMGQDTVDQDAVDRCKTKERKIHSGKGSKKAIDRKLPVTVMGILETRGNYNTDNIPRSSAVPMSINQRGG